MPSSPFDNSPGPHLPSDSVEAANGRPDRALVVDDDPNIREVLHSALTRVGYEVETVGSGQEALESFARRGADVVVTDWNMPGLNGIELVNRLKQKDPYLAAILMTGVGTKETVIDAFTRGKINYYLTKPFKMGDLLEIVAGAIKERKLQLRERSFRQRLEKEVQKATEELERKNRLLQQKNEEAEALYHELQSRQDEIKSTKEYLENLIESSVDGIITLDHAHRIDFFSRGSEEMFGIEADDILGRSIGELFSQGESDLNRLLDRLKAESRLKHFEVEMVRRSGRKLAADISASILSRKGSEDGLLLIIKDVDDRKRLEDELRASNAALEKLSLTDGLTELFNHRHFQKCLSEEFQRSRRFDNPLSLIMLDLDDFKLVNDTYGHQVGDEVLMALADIIRESIREVDIPARYGGEEFAVILPQTDLKNAIGVAERLKAAVEKSVHFRQIRPEISITASLGLSGYPDPGIKSPHDLIRFADKALYRAKQIGKNRVVVGGAAGETPLGRGERLTQSEKRAILRRVSDTLRGMLDLDEILSYLLKEIAAALRQDGWEPPCLVVLMDKNRGLVPAADLNLTPENQEEFERAARLALEKRTIQVIQDQENRKGLTAYPIILDSPSRGQEVVGIINIGTVPADPAFFQELANQAALGIVNAKLFHEVEASKTALEKKVNELTVLSLMNMALQQNALNFADFQRENRKLLARCLVQIGFERVLVYKYGPDGQVLHSGVDGSLRGENAPATVSLKGLDPQSPFIQALTREEADGPEPIIIFSLKENLTSRDKKIIKALDLGRGQAAVARMSEAGQIKELVIAGKPQISEDDRDGLAMFLLHAGLVMENLNLSQMYHEKNSRLALIHETVMHLSNAGSPGARTRAAEQTLQNLTGVLQAAEISVYSFQENDETLELVAYASASAKPGREPCRQIKLKDSRIMGRVIEEAKKSGRSTPLVLDDVRDILGSASKKRFSTSSYLGVPLFGGGRIIGIMNVADKLDHSPFSKDDLELAQVTAGLLASVLQNIFMLSELEAEGVKLIFALVRVLEDQAGPGAKGRAERMVELAARLAETLALDQDEIAFTRRFAFCHALKKLEQDQELGPSGETIKTGAKVLSDWISRHLDPAVFPGASSQAGQGPKKGPVQEIISVADRFDSSYLSLKTRPSLTEALLDVLAEMARSDRMEVIEALFRTALRGQITASGRKIRPGPEDFEFLTDVLAAPSKKSKGSTIPAELREKFGRIVQEERSSRHGR